MDPHVVLTGYYRSTTSYRVRIALNLKGIDYQNRALSLLKGEHKSAENLKINPQGFVPTLAVDGAILLQSPAILEWLEEAYPDPPLLPSETLARQRVRAMANIVACDIHPLNNLRVLSHLRQHFAASEEAITRWIWEWIGAGFTALETLLRQDTERAACCVGNTPTLADCNLIPQVYSAKRFGMSMNEFPLICAVAEHCGALPAFAAAHPDRQPDAPATQ